MRRDEYLLLDYHSIELEHETDHTCKGHGRGESHDGVGSCDPLGLKKMMAYPAWQKAFPELTGAVEDPCTPVGNEVVDNTYSAGQFIDQPAEVTTAWKMTVAGNRKV